MNNSTFEEAGSNLMSLTVRLIGLFLLLAGIWIAIKVMLEAYSLYREPQRIERYAIAIERGSNIDKSLSSFREETVNQSDENKTVEGQESVTVTQDSGNIRVSYFFAWIIVLLLLLLIARISLSAIKTGGELVLYDLQIRQLAKKLIKESGKNIH